MTTEIFTTIGEMIMTKDILNVLGTLCLMKGQFETMYLASPSSNMAAKVYTDTVKKIENIIADLCFEVCKTHNTEKFISEATEENQNPSHDKDEEEIDKAVTALFEAVAKNFCLSQLVKGKKNE